MRISFVAAAILIVSSVLTAKSAGAATVLRFRTAHGPSDVVNVALEEFRKQVEAKTHGRVQVKLLDLFHPHTDFNENNLENLNDVAAGHYEMTQVIVGYLSQYVTDFRALEIPFLFRDHSHVFAVVDGPTGTELFERLKKKSPVEGLAYTYSGGNRVVATREKELHKPEDLNGLTLGSVMPSPERIFYTSLGVHVMPVGQNMDSDLKGAKIDGLLMAYPEYLHAHNWWQQAPVVSTIHSSIQLTALVINKRALQRMRAADRVIVKQEAASAAQLERKLSIAMETEAVQSSAKLGLKIVSLTTEERARFAERAIHMDWSSYLGISPELIQQIRQQPSQPSPPSVADGGAKKSAAE